MWPAGVGTWWISFLLHNLHLHSCYCSRCACEHVISWEWEPQEHNILSPFWNSICLSCYQQQVAIRVSGFAELESPRILYSGVLGLPSHQHNAHETHHPMPWIMPSRPVRNSAPAHGRPTYVRLTATWASGMIMSPGQWRSSKHGFMWNGTNDIIWLDKPAGGPINRLTSTRRSELKCAYRYASNGREHIVVFEYFALRILKLIS